MSDDLNTEERGIPRLVPPRLARQEAAMHDEHGDTADALAALSFLEREEAPVQPRFTQPQSPRSPGQSPPVPQVVEPRSTSPTGSVAASIRSSFAPSKQAAQRKAKSQAQHAAQQAAVNRPGRANGRQRKMRDANAWGESSEEEEEEDEEEDEDADSDEEPRQRTMSMDKRGMGSNSQVNVGQQPTPEGSPGPNQRRPRDLPRIPGQQPQPQGAFFVTVNSSIYSILATQVLRNILVPSAVLFLTSTLTPCTPMALTGSHLPNTRTQLPRDRRTAGIKFLNGSNPKLPRVTRSCRSNRRHKR